MIYYAAMDKKLQQINEVSANQKKIYIVYEFIWASQMVVKNLPAKAGDMRLGFDPRVGKIPWRKTWQPTPVLLPGESHGQRKLAGYSPWGHRRVGRD